MRKYLFALVIVFSIGTLPAQNAIPQIANVQVLQNGTTLTIQYDLSDAENDLIDIRFRAGEVGSVLLDLNTSNASGDLGPGMQAGSGKTISWDFSAYSSIGPNFRIMLVADDQQPVDIQDLVDQVDSARLYNDVLNLEGIRHRTAAPAHLSTVQQLLTTEMNAHALETHIQSFAFGGYQAQNIIGRHIGTTDEATYFMIDGHYDSVDDSPGADDNASAVAGVLEAMRILTPYAFEKSIKFVGFDLEETGLIGSGHYANNRDIAETIGGVFNLEMIGYYSDQPNSQTLPAGFSQIFPAAVSQIAGNNYRGDFITVTADLNSTSLSAAFSNAAQTYVPGLNTIVLDIPVSSSLVPDLRRSDHASFWNINAPAVMITDGANFRNNNYHTPADQIGTLNFTFMKQVVQATIAAVAELADIEHASTYWEDTSFGVSLEEEPSCAWEVFPNPASGEVFIQLVGCRMKGASVRLFDAQGKLVLETELDIETEAHKLEIKDMAPGSYTLSLLHDDKKSVKKLLIE